MKWETNIWGVRMLKKLATAALLILTPSVTQAQAWDGMKTGKLTRIDVVTNGANFGFRVYMDVREMCGNDGNWAFINKGDSNYDAMVALLLSAHMNSKSITLLSTKEGPYCHIGYVILP